MITGVKFGDQVHHVWQTCRLCKETTFIGQSLNSWKWGYSQLTYMQGQNFRTKKQADIIRTSLVSWFYAVWNKKVFSNSKLLLDKYPIFLHSVTHWRHNIRQVLDVTFKYFFWWKKCWFLFSNVFYQCNSISYQYITYHS